MDYGLRSTSYGLWDKHTTHNPEPRTQKGFTLLELLIAVAIIAILIAIALPRYLEATNRAKTAADRGNIRLINAQIELYQLNTGYYPSYPYMDELLNSASYFPDGRPECPFLKGNTDTHQYDYRLNICSAYHGYTPYEENATILSTCTTVPQLMRVVERQHRDIHASTHEGRWIE